MNKNKKDINEEFNIQQVIERLSGLGFSEDEIRSDLFNTARLGIGRTIEILESQYEREAGIKRTSLIAKDAIRVKAYYIYIGICKRLIDELRESAQKTDKNF